VAKTPLWKGIQNNAAYFAVLDGAGVGKYGAVGDFRWGWVGGTVPPLADHLPANGGHADDGKNDGNDANDQDYISSQFLLAFALVTGSLSLGSSRFGRRVFRRRARMRRPGGEFPVVIANHYPSGPTPVSTDSSPFRATL
jgi:hypothetical protein